MRCRKIYKIWIIQRNIFQEVIIFLPIVFAQFFVLKKISKFYFKYKISKVNSSYRSNTKVKRFVTYITKVENINLNTTVSVCKGDKEDTGFCIIIEIPFSVWHAGPSVNFNRPFITLP